MVPAGRFFSLGILNDEACDITVHSIYRLTPNYAFLGTSFRRERRQSMHPLSLSFPFQDINSPTDSVIGRDFQELSAEEQERQREEWKAELNKTEEEILTLKQVLTAKERHAAGED